MSTEALSSTIIRSQRPAPSRQPFRLAWPLALLVVWAGVTIWSRDVIHSPPYEDQAIGWWLEADFLADSGFNYYELRYGQQHYQNDESGVRSYMISVLPTLLALLMTISPDVPTTIVVIHLFGSACAAAILLMVFAVVRRRVGTVAAVLTSLALFSTPAFNTQIKIVGMDIPLTVFALLAAICVWRQHYVAASLVSTVAFFMKATGGLIVMATLVYLTLRWMLGGRRIDPLERRRIHRGLIANSVALIAQTAIVAWGDTSVPILWGTDWPKVWSLPYAVYWCPDLVLVFFVALSLSLARLAVDVAHQTARRPEGATLSGWRVALGEVLRQRGMLVFCWIAVLGMVAASGLYIFIPRYFTCAMPFLFIGLGLAVFSWPAARLSGVVTFLALIVFNFANMDGRFYPRIESAAGKLFQQTATFHARSCPFTERSSEYLLDHRSNQAAARLLETHYADHPILAPRPILHYLSEPRLGYVERPLRVYNASTFQGAITGFLAAMTDPSAATHKDPIFVWSGVSRTTLPPPEPEDEILYDDGLPTPLIVYRKRLPVAASKADLKAWFLAHTWPGPWPAERLQGRILYLTDQGQLEQAIDSAIEAKRMGTTVAKPKIDELLHELRLRRAAELKATGHVDQAIEQVRRDIRRESRNVRLQNLHADLVGSVVVERLDKHDAPEAIKQIETAIDADAENAKLHSLLRAVVDRRATDLADHHEFDAALRTVRDALRRNAEDPQLLRLLNELERTRRGYAEQAARFAIPAADRHGDPASATKEFDAMYRAIDRRLTEFCIRQASRRPWELAEVPSTVPQDSLPAIDHVGSAYAEGVNDLIRGNWQCAVEKLTAAAEGGLAGRSAALARLAAGIAQLEKGDLDEAADSFGKALDGKLELTESIYYLGIVRLQQGRLDEAVRRLRQTVELVPDFAAAHDQLAVALARANRITPAVRHAQEAVRLDPQDRLARLHLKALKKLQPRKSTPAPIGSASSRAGISRTSHVKLCSVWGGCCEARIINAFGQQEIWLRHKTFMAPLRVGTLNNGPYIV